MDIAKGELATFGMRCKRCVLYPSFQSRCHGVPRAEYNTKERLRAVKLECCIKDFRKLEKFVILKDGKGFKRKDGGTQGHLAL